MKLQEIVKQFRNEHCLTIDQFATSCGLSKGYISMIENGRNPNTGRPIVPGMDSLSKLSIGLGLSVDELVAMLDDNQRISLLPDNIIPMPNMRKIPLLGTIACGEPILAVENIDGDVDIPDHIHADFALRCKGDSMINARIFDGDIVYIRQQPDVENSEIAAVLIGDEATLKRVYKAENQVTLMPANDTYPPMVYTGSQLDDIRILGKAVAFSSVIR